MPVTRLADRRDWETAPHGGWFRRVRNAKTSSLYSGHDPYVHTV